MRKVWLLLGFGLLALLASCGGQGGGAGTPPFPGNPPIGGGPTPPPGGGTPPPSGGGSISGTVALGQTIAQGTVQGSYVFALYYVQETDSFDEGKSKWIQVQQSGRQAAYSIGGLQSGYYVLLAWKDVDRDREISYNDYLGIYTDSSGNVLVTPGRSGVNITMEAAYVYASLQGLPGGRPFGALPDLLPGTR
jgi:hypothetical protein